jgi:hypothetical protein
VPVPPAAARPARDRRRCRARAVSGRRGSRLGLGPAHQAKPDRRRSLHPCTGLCVYRLGYLRKFPSWGSGKRRLCGLSCNRCKIAQDALNGAGVGGTICGNSADRRPIGGYGRPNPIFGNS